MKAKKKKNKKNKIKKIVLSAAAVIITLRVDYLLAKKFTVYIADKLQYKQVTVFHLITAHTPISAQSRNSVVFRLQPVYFLSTPL